MKKYLYSSLLVALMAVLSFSLVSCDDDDDTDLEYSIIGTWEQEYQGGWGYDWTYKQYLQFKSNGTFIQIEDDNGVSISYGTWTISGNALSIYYTSGSQIGASFTYTIKELTANTLSITILGATATFVRVSDDTIDQYL